MAAESPEMPLDQALAGLNRAFLRLLCATPAGMPAFGLDPAVLLRLRALDGARLTLLARSPVLLAGCRLPLGESAGEATAGPAGAAVGPASGPGNGAGIPHGPRPGEGVADAPPAATRRGFEPPCQVYATALLTWLWQVNRADPLVAALHTGPSAALPAWLGRASFRDLERAAALAPAWLEARFARNPRLWPDLVRAAAAGDAALLEITRLSLVQLALVPARLPPNPSAPRPQPPETSHYNARR